ncbi:MAG: CoA-binding protein [Candidatus Thorarchaeota archaeon]
MLEKDIAKILLESKTIAIVGASRDPEKAAHNVPKYLQTKGYKIIPVNPSANEILGEKAYHSLSEITEPVDIIDIFRPSEYTPEIIKEAVKLKPKLIWMQLGISNEEAKMIAKNHGIKIVMNKCMKIEHLDLIHP